MKVDKALAYFCNSSELRRGGDTGRRRVKHRNFLQLRFTHHNVRYRLFEQDYLDVLTSHCYWKFDTKQDLKPLHRVRH